MKSWDAIIVGGGVIGLSLACRLRTHSLDVLVVEKQALAREATYAAGGMIAHCDPNNPPDLKPLAAASASMYPEFVRELEIDSGERVDLRDVGTIAYFDQSDIPDCAGAHALTEAELAQLEPPLMLRGRPWFLPECSVDPRSLGSALVKAAAQHGVDVVTGHPAIEVIVAENRAAGVRTAHSAYPSAVVVNCCGAWAGQIQPLGIPTHPVKGQMVCVVPEPGAAHVGPLVRHVVRTPDVYIIPRSDGRILLGATVEDAGFDKQVDPDTIQRLFKAAIRTVPQLAGMRIHDAWAGLRPASPDKLPIMGETSLPGYYAGTGHYRDGILLAPITAHLMTQLITGCRTDFDLTPFSPLRFG